TLDEMADLANPAARHHRQRHRGADLPQQVEIEALAGAVAIHAGEQDLAGPERRHATATGEHVEPGAAAAAMREHLPAPGAGSAGIDRHHDALAAELLRRL